MKSFSIFAVSLALAAALAISASPARAQAEAAAAAAATEIVAPVVVKTITAVSPKPKLKGNWLKAEVIHFDAHSMIVREDANERAIHTFTYAPALQDKMQQLVDKGGYQYGDKVKILFQQDPTVALRVYGKPSKPL